MVRREAAGEGVRGLEGADTPLPLLFGSVLQGTASLLLSWDELIICKISHLPVMDLQRSSRYNGMPNEHGNPAMLRLKASIICNNCN